MSFIANLKQTIAQSNRLVIVLVGAGVVAIGLYYWNLSPAPVPASTVFTPNSVQKTVQAKKPLSPEYDTHLVQNDQQRIDRAAASGASAVPTVKIVEQDQVPMPQPARDPATDLDRLPRPVPPQIEKPVVALAPVTPTLSQAPSRIVDNSPQIDNMANAMRVQLMDLGKIAYPAADVKYISKIAAGPAQAAGPATVAQLQTASGTAPQTGSIGGIPLPLAGTIIYAELIGEANSDAPGPIIAKVLQGELAGATLIGSFSTMRESLVLRFSTISLGTSAAGDEINKSVSVSAVGVDTKTVSPGIVTDVDHHILSNVGISAATAFVSGFGSAIAQSGQIYTTTSGVGTQVTNPARSVSQNMWIAGGQAANAMSSTMSAIYGNRPTTVMIAAGTPIGVLFMPN